MIDPDAGGPSGDITPAVSIIMPVRNERAHIEAAVQSALDQDLDVPFEVIVADGASDDGTREILDDYAARDRRLRIVANPYRTTPCGLNQALRAVHGQYFVRLDGHSVAPPDYARRLLDRLESGQCDGAGGLVRAVGRSRFGKAVAKVHGSRFAIGNAQQHYARTPIFVDHVAHGAYSTERARVIGGFDEEFTRNQDYEFNYRYHSAGGRLLLDPSAPFDWNVRETPSRLAQQYFQYGYWKFRALRRHPSSLHLRWLVPPAFVLTVALGSIGARKSAGRHVLAAAVGPYAALIAAGSVSNARTLGSRSIPLTALALVIIHVSWGSGFLAAAAQLGEEQAAIASSRTLNSLRRAVQRRR